MRFFALAPLITLLLLWAHALPTRDNSVVSRTVSALAIAEALAESVTLYVRDPDIKIGANPNGDAHCGATDRYGAHTYTSNQIMVAFMAGAKLSAGGKQVGASMFPVCIARAKHSLCVL
jgi:hypothetical protein